MSRRAAIVSAAIALALGSIVTSCGDDDTTSTTDTDAPTTTISSTEQVCSDREALRDAVSALTDVDVVAEGTSGIEAAVTDVRESLDALRSSASADLQPDVDALRDALDSLQTAIGDIGSAGVSGVASAAQDVASAGRTLLDRLDGIDCG